MPRNHEGRSVASMWGDMLAEAERGEVVVCADRFGNDVAVMVSLEKFRELTGIDLGADDDGAGGDGADLLDRE